MTTTTDWRYGIRHSRMVCLIWSDLPKYQAIQRTKLAYAQELGKPIRLLCLEGNRLPEDLCAGYADVQTARVTTQADAAQQIQAWLRELEEQ
jgi:hypothetical protein